MITLYHADALQTLKKIPDESVHLCVTDPPYFIDGMGDDWDKTKVDSSIKKAGVIGSMPVGMKFDRQQGLDFYDFMHSISNEVYRILKPGAFYISFSQGRLYHRLGVAVEDAGFEVRDMLTWLRDGQIKAFSQDHFVRKMKISDSEKETLVSSMAGRKTPQLRPMHEPMVLAQKPKNGTFVQNWQEHRTGLVDVTQTLSGQTGTVAQTTMAVKKPSKEQKGENNDHPTVKPVELIEHIIKIFSIEGQTVIDPFLGSGSHGVAAVESGRNFIGIEKEKRYLNISADRISAVTDKPIQFY